MFFIVDKLFAALRILILLRIILSWIAPYSRNEFTELINHVTEPILKPFRILIPLGRMRIDFSPILALIALNIVRNLVFRLLFTIF